MVGRLCILCSVCLLVPSEARCDDLMFSMGADFCVLFAYFSYPDLCVDRLIWLNARSASARGVSFALGFSFFVNIQLIGGQTKALDQQNLYSDLYSMYS